MSKQEPNGMFLDVSTLDLITSLNAETAKDVLDALKRVFNDGDYSEYLRPTSHNDFCPAVFSFIFGTLVGKGYFSEEQAKASLLRGVGDA